VRRRADRLHCTGRGEGGQSGFVAELGDAERRYDGRVDVGAGVVDVCSYEVRTRVAISPCTRATLQHPLGVASLSRCFDTRYVRAGSSANV
jgi:hypothetical protein